MAFGMFFLAEPRLAALRLASESYVSWPVQEQLDALIQLTAIDVRVRKPALDTPNTSDVAFLFNYIPLDPQFRAQLPRHSTGRGSRAQGAGPKYAPLNS